jgi:hypothetical protein
MGSMELTLRLKEPGVSLAIPLRASTRKCKDGLDPTLRVTSSRPERCRVSRSSGVLLQKKRHWLLTGGVQLVP